MAAHGPSEEQRRSRAMAAAVARFWGLGRPQAAAWMVVTVLGPALPLAVTVASGLPDLRRGAGSRL